MSGSWAALFSACTRFGDIHVPAGAENGFWTENYLDLVLVQEGSCKFNRFESASIPVFNWRVPQTKGRLVIRPRNIRRVSMPCSVVRCVRRGGENLHTYTSLNVGHQVSGDGQHAPKRCSARMHDVESLRHHPF